MCIDHRLMEAVDCSRMLERDRDCDRESELASELFVIDYVFDGPLDAVTIFDSENRWFEEELLHDVQVARARPSPRTGHRDRNAIAPRSRLDRAEIAPSRVATWPGV